MTALIALLFAHQTHCPYCGAELARNYDFCPSCGRRVW
jgi:predicted amidophosphoribosyltransferase